jgi:MOSC domain-containing protein YiiM
MATLVSIQVGKPDLRSRDVGLARPIDHPWHSAIFKSPVEGAVMLRRTNLEGDGQADLLNHGGPDMAVLCYSAEHYPMWRGEMGIEEMGPGAFGENLTVSGQDELSVRVGDVYQVGEAVVQVSKPRGPCYKISYRWRRPDLLARVVATGRHGWYVRVLREGLVEAGQKITLVERPHPEWTVRRAADVYQARKHEPEAALELARCEALSESIRAEILGAR